jgi:hypothetical protein
MINHAYVHDMMMLLAAPVAAVAVGLCGKLLLDVADGAGESSIRRSVRWGALVVLPAVLLLALPLNIVDRVIGVRRGDVDVSFGRAIKAATEPGAVVMVRTPSMLPVYYSERHVIRGIAGDEAVDTLGERVRQEFPGAPIYLALRPLRDIQEFPGSLQRLRLVKRSPDLVLLAITDDNRGGAALPTMRRETASMPASRP